MDEGRHHRFFARYLPRLWEDALSVADRDVLAPLLPRFIAEFSAPDREGLRHELLGYGLTYRQVEVVCADLYAPEHLRTQAAATGATTLRYLERCGALDHGRLSDALGAAGLVS